MAEKLVPARASSVYIRRWDQSAARANLNGQLMHQLQARVLWQHASRTHLPVCFRAWQLNTTRGLLFNLWPPPKHSRQNTPVRGAVDLRAGRGATHMHAAYETYIDHRVCMRQSCREQIKVGRCSLLTPETGERAFHCVASVTIFCFF